MPRAGPKGLASGVFFMYLCYLDESGSPEIGKDTPHFVFLGLAIPATTWRRKDAEINRIKGPYGLTGKEIHSSWMARRYVEQEKIQGFEALDWDARRKAVEREQQAVLLRIAALKGPEQTRNVKKNFRMTAPYIHLTRTQRLPCLSSITEVVGGWYDCPLFAEAIDKSSFGTQSPKHPPFEEAFSQVVSRFHAFLEGRGGDRDQGLLVQDNNPTAASRLTLLMRSFHQAGTLFTRIPRIVETPLFVDSALTSMVQLSDLCAYATRRFFENNETDLFDRIYPRFHRVGRKLVGLRHYTGTRACNCKVCSEHRGPAAGLPRG